MDYVLCFVLTLGMPKVCTGPYTEAVCHMQMADWIERGLAWSQRQPVPIYRMMAGCVPIRCYITRSHS